MRKHLLSKIKSLMRTWKENRILGFTTVLFSINVSALSVTRERSTRKDGDVTPAKETRDAEVGKGETVMTRISIPRALWPLGRGGSFRGRTYPLPVSTKYTVHRACNVPLSADPTGLHTRARTHVHVRTHTRARHIYTHSPPGGGLPYDL